MTRTELELAIDTHGLCAILEAIADICGDKEDHIMTNWQDTALAHDWARANYYVSKLAADINRKAPAVQLGHAKDNCLPV